MWAAFNRFALNIIKAQVLRAYHAGAMDNDIMFLSKVPGISRQLKKNWTLNRYGQNWQNMAHGMRRSYRITRKICSACYGSESLTFGKNCRKI